MSNNIKPAMPTVGSFKSKPATIPLHAGPVTPVTPVSPVPVSPVGY
jgi:hypothetical protein